MSQSGVHQISGGGYIGDSRGAPADPEGLPESGGRIQAWARGGGLPAWGFGSEAGAGARHQHEPLFTWRRAYRAGKFGAPDPVHLALPIAPAIPVAVTNPEPAVTLLPVHASPAEVVPAATPPCIEVVFARATVRIFGVPAMAPLRLVLDCLARRA